MIEHETQLTAFTFSAVYLFIPSLPVTHALGLLAHLPKAAKLKHLLLYPFKGGKNHTIFQIISWVIWAASILVAVPVLLQNESAHIPGSHTEILSGAAAVGSIFAELFMIQSLLVFDPAVRMMQDEQPSSPVYNRRAIPSKPMAATATTALGALWVSMAAALIWATEFLWDNQTKALYIALAAACLLVGVTTTHGLGGKLWHARASVIGGEAATAWRFFQPFRGGAAFIATQALGWALFSSALTTLVWLIAQVAAGMAYCIRCWLLGTSLVMASAWLVLGVSIWTYQGPGSARAAKERVKAASEQFQPSGRIWLPILALYTPVHLFAFVVVSSFLLLPVRFAAAFWVGSLVVYYAVTAQGNPSHTGAREWPWLKDWLRQNLGAALRAWLGNLEVVYDGSSGLTPDRHYVFGYHPHGLFPIGAPYLPLLKEFRELFPRVSPTPLVASVCFMTPIVRDLLSWCGVRQVSRRSFVKALTESGAVIMVPGGQAELVHTWRFFKQKEFVIYTRHKGFVRLAIQQQACLVPVLCLGEIGALRNVCNWPAMQQWTYKNIGFPIPYLVVGRWGLTPFPRQTGLRFIIGEPLSPPSLDSDGQVSEAAVAELHAQYYAEVEKLYGKYSHSFPGYENMRLVMF